MEKKELEIKAKAYALKNAIAHNGKAQIGSVIAGLFKEGLKKTEMKKNGKIISEIVNGVNKYSLEEQKSEFENLKSKVHERKIRKGLRPLPKAKKGKVIMRFAPSASGPLHIGHALTACLSFLYVKKYKGKFYMRIEDTNPENSYKDSYKMIENDSKWLFGNKAKIIIQSERLKIYYKYAEKLIKLKKAYVCTCSQEKFKEFVKIKKDCPCRALDVKENLERWKKMLDKSSKGYAQGKVILRFKSPLGMKDPNPAMRDFPLARINLNSHPLQIKKYKVWPLMNLAVAVDDIEQKMTHIIRAKDHRDNAKRQEMIYNALGLKSKIPWTAFLGRIKFKHLELSTSKLRQEIKSGKFTGWGDKNLPTLVSLKKQGYKPEAFFKFAEKVGLSEVDKVIDEKEYFTLLNGFNKE